MDVFVRQDSRLGFQVHVNEQAYLLALLDHSLEPACGEVPLQILLIRVKVWNLPPNLVNQDLGSYDLIVLVVHGPQGSTISFSCQQSLLRN